jgi:hypothetical protein
MIYAAVEHIATICNYAQGFKYLVLTCGRCITKTGGNHLKSEWLPCVALLLSYCKNYTDFAQSLITGLFCGSMRVSDKLPTHYGSVLYFRSFLSKRKGNGYCTAALILKTLTFSNI